MATVADVAKWHRRYEQAALDAARSAHFGYVAGCEDALFVAHGWRKQSEQPEARQRTTDASVAAEGSA